MSGKGSCLGAWRLGFALGLIWALGMLILGWASWLWGYGVPMVNLWGSVYIGFAPTFIGGIIGAIWGFVDFFIFGVLIAWVYNCCCCKRSSGEA